ncbi:WD40 repeat domain-containing protein [Vairimorpha necatrix]|uniref:Protein HIR n=1 Tax=Vairimorpha necatrix TaxID=6039 RepID=A0AAX4JEE8_9MICR
MKILNLFTKLESKKPVSIFSLDILDKMIVTACTNGDVDLYKNEDKLYKTVKKHAGSVLCVRFNPKGNFIASCGDDGTVIIYDLELQAIFSCKFHNGDVTNVLWTDKYLISVGHDGFIIFYDNQNFKVLSKIKSHENKITGVAASRKNNFICTQGDDGLTLYKNNVIYKKIPPNEGIILESFFSRMSWSPDGLIFSCGLSFNQKMNSIEIYNIEMESKYSLLGHVAPCEVTSFNPNTFTTDSKQYFILAVGSQDLSISLWTTLSPYPFLLVKNVCELPILDLTWSSDGSSFYFCAYDGKVGKLEFNLLELGNISNLDNKIENSDLFITLMNAESYDSKVQRLIYPRHIKEKSENYRPNINNDAKMSKNKDFIGPRRPADPNHPMYKDQGNIIDYMNRPKKELKEEMKNVSDSSHKYKEENKYIIEENKDNMARRKKTTKKETVNNETTNNETVNNDNIVPTDESIIRTIVDSVRIIEENQNTTEAETNTLGVETNINTPTLQDNTVDTTNNNVETNNNMQTNIVETNNNEQANNNVEINDTRRVTFEETNNTVESTINTPVVNIVRNNTQEETELTPAEQARINDQIRNPALRLRDVRDVVNEEERVAEEQRQAAAQRQEAATQARVVRKRSIRPVATPDKNEMTQISMFNIKEQVKIENGKIEEYSKEFGDYTVELNPEKNKLTIKRFSYDFFEIHGDFKFLCASKKYICVYTTDIEIYSLKTGTLVAPLIGSGNVLYMDIYRDKVLFLNGDGSIIIFDIKNNKIKTTRVPRYDTILKIKFSKLYNVICHYKDCSYVLDKPTNLWYLLRKEWNDVHTKKTDYNNTIDETLKRLENSFMINFKIKRHDKLKEIARKMVKQLKNLEMTDHLENIYSNIFKGLVQLGHKKFTYNCMKKLGKNLNLQYFCNKIYLLLLDSKKT